MKKYVKPTMDIYEFTMNNVVTESDPTPSNIEADLKSAFTTFDLSWLSF